MAIRQFGCLGFVFALLIFPGTGFASCDNFYGNKDGVPSRHELEAQKILEDSKPAAEKDVEALALKCRSDVTCLEKGLKAIFYENVKKQKKFWKAVDEKTNSSLCLKGGMGSAVHALAARSNYFKTAAITIAGIGIGWATGLKEKVTLKNADGTELSFEKKPYSLIGEAIISGAIFAEAACRTTAKGVGASGEEKTDPLLSRMKNYIAPVFLGSLIFTGLSVGQDYFIYDQKEAISAKSLKDYFFLGLASVMFEGMYAVGHAVKMDDVMVNGLPRLQQFVANWVKSPAVQSRLPQILKGGKSLAELEAQVVSHLSETALRVGYFAVKINAWTYFSDAVIPKLKESPLFNFMFEEDSKAKADSSIQKTE